MTTHDLRFVPNGKVAYKFEDTDIHLQGIDGLDSNAIKVLTTPLYGQDGEVFIGSNQKMRIVTVDWVIRNELTTKRRDIARAFNPNLGQGVLVYENDGAKYKINAITALKPKTEKLVYNQIKAEYNMSFLCAKPDWLDYTATQLKLEAFTGGLVYPKIYPFVYATKGEGGKIDYVGDNPASVIIDIRGSAPDAVDPIITNSTTGETITTQNIDLGTDEKLLIDTNPDAPSVKLVSALGVETDAWEKIVSGSKFWQLEYGLNEIAFSSTSGSPELYITYSNHYSGV